MRLTGLTEGLLDRQSSMIVWPNYDVVINARLIITWFDFVLSFRFVEELGAGGRDVWLILLCLLQPEVSFLLLDQVGFMHRNILVEDLRGHLQVLLILLFYLPKPLLLQLFKVSLLQFSSRWEECWVGQDLNQEALVQSNIEPRTWNQNVLPVELDVLTLSD